LRIMLGWNFQSWYNAPMICYEPNVLFALFFANFYVFFVDHSILWCHGIWYDIMKNLWYHTSCDVIVDLWYHAMNWDII
jgi:hypothetical protein